MIRAFIEGFLQLKDPRIFGLVVRAALLALALYVVLLAGLVSVLRATEVSQLRWIEVIADWGAGLAAAVIATILFPGLVTALLCMFLDTVAAAVEALHYPTLGPARSISIAESLASALRLAVWLIGLNLLLLPLYVLLVFLPPFNVIAYAAINGRLIGREYFETVASRRLSPANVNALRVANRGTLWLAGSITAALLTIPLLNLVAPVVGVAAMVHIFHKLTARS
jgi:uncharacterized protein involved in cysteine biosynthesis